jgi:TetR/AcrR family transcriptional regulator, transcriptional repressor for nem operon
MSRQANSEKSAIVDQAMHLFWENGFNGASIDALVKSIGTTRFSLYQTFGGKEGLFLAALERYSEIVVGQALILIKAEADGINGIRNYFEHLISVAQKSDCLSRGCLMANSMVEFGDLHGKISATTHLHFQRVISAMAEAISRSSSRATSKAQANSLALFISTFAQGLWLRARAGDDAKTLRSAYQSALLAL